MQNPLFLYKPYVMILRKWTAKEKKTYEEFQALIERSKNATEPIRDELESEKAARIERLLGNFAEFCNYYFPHYVSAPFGYFHKEAAKEIESDPTILAVLEWPREHAKSVYVDVLLPMYLKALGQLTGMMIASANEDKAKGLLGDIQAELMGNQRYAEDFGIQYSRGDWQDGSFATADGVGFWAFGRGQSPRGTRKAEKRPNYGVCDDIDDNEIVKNEQRVKDVVNWILSDFYGALSIEGARLIAAGNRIHNRSILAHLVGDITPEDPKREGIYHSKVYAIEAAPGVEGTEETGQPAWIERYSFEMLNDRISKMGYRASQREFFHRHVLDGNIFKPEHIQWAVFSDVKHYQYLVSYVDPSFKDTKKSDYKAIVLLGKWQDKYYDILWAWVRQASRTAMVDNHYEMLDLIGDVNARHYIEGNFIQDDFLNDYDTAGEQYGFAFPIRSDTRQKPQKEGRIESLSALFERGLVRFNEKYRKSYDMQTLIDQFLGFPNGHDDGPDAVEGAIFKLNEMSRQGSKKARMGKYKRSTKF